MEKFTPNNVATSLNKQIEQEVRQYLTELVSVGEHHDFSQYKLTRRIALFESKVYPRGKFDSQKNYKYWHDVIGPAIDDEVKNVDFDTKDVLIYSNRKNDDLTCIIANLKLKQFLQDTGQAEEINSAIEEGSGWGNVLWKKVKRSYERCDLRNTYIVNQTARSVDDTPIIERHQLTASDLRAKMSVWHNVKDVLEQCKMDTYKTEIASQEKDTTVPYYELYERTGEVCLKDLKEWRGEETTDNDAETYVLARVIGAGSKGTDAGTDIKYIVFASELNGKRMSDIFKEFHRGRYKGRWWREGLYELLFDLQVRANQVGNQLAQGLELAAKSFYTAEEKTLVQNILTDIRNGAIIKAKNLQHVESRMNAADQLFAEWNRIIQQVNRISHATEIVQGESQPNQPFRLGALVNQNANKIYDFIREKFSIPLTEIFYESIVPELVSDLKGKDILSLTGDPDMLNRFQVAIVELWYRDNLVSLPPHTKEQADMIKGQKLQELMMRPQMAIKGFKALFEDFKPHVRVVISGENSTLDIDLQTLGSFAQLEPDPVRRSGILDLMMKRKGIDVGALPRSPAPAAPPAGAPAPAPVAA